MIQLSDIPIIILLCGICFFLSGMLFLYLNSKQNVLAQEISYVFAAGLYVGFEVLFGIYSEFLTIPMVILVFILTSYEAFKPLDTVSGSQPERVHESDAEVLIFKKGREYHALSAVKVTSIPFGKDSSWKKRIEGIEQEQQLWRDVEELRWLMPVWEGSQQPPITYTLDMKLERGLVSLYLFCSSQHKRCEVVRDELAHAKVLISTWLTRKDYEYHILSPDEVWKEYVDMNLAFEFDSTALGSEQVLGFLSIDGIPSDPSNDIAKLVRHLSVLGLQGHFHLSFQADRMPRLRSSSKDVQKDEKTILPHKLESHHMRDLYRELNEVEICEGTGSFRVSSYLLIENVSSASFREELKRVSGIVSSIWAGVRILTVPTTILRGKSTEIALRGHLQRTTRVSGARLSSLLHFSDGVSGIESRTVAPEFASPRSVSTDVGITHVGQVLQRGRPTRLDFRIPVDQYVHDVGIFGIPGSGKTNTAFQVVHELNRNDIPFLVLTPSKKEWRLLCNRIRNVRVFPTRAIRFNFLQVQEGVHVSTHISNIVTCFTAWWPSEGIIAEHITRIFQRAFAQAGWDLYSGERGEPILLPDLYAAMEAVSAQLKYGANLKQDFHGALSARFDRLVTDPILSVMFNCEKGLSIPDLLDHKTILELNDLEDKDKALVSSLLLVSVAEYLEANSTPSRLENKLKHLLIMEEAHHLLKNVSRGNVTEGHASQQQAITTIIQLLRESRGLGLGLVLIDQLPADLAPEVVKLVGTSIIHNLPSEDRLLVGSRANLTEEQIGFIGHLRCGEAIVHQGLYGEAVHVKIKEFVVDPDPSEPPWTDERVRSHMADFYVRNPDLSEVNIPTIDNWVPNAQVVNNLRFMVSADRFPEHYQQRVLLGEDSVEQYLHEMILKTLSRMKVSDTSASNVERYHTVLEEIVAERLEESTFLAPVEKKGRKSHA